MCSLRLFLQLCQNSWATAPSQFNNLSRLLNDLCKSLYLNTFYTKQLRQQISTIWEASMFVANQVSTVERRKNSILRPTCKVLSWWTANITLLIYVVAQFYPWFKFYFPLFQTHNHTLPYPKTESFLWLDRLPRSFAGGSSMEKALNLRLFAKSWDHPQWRSGYVRSGQTEGTGFKSC